MFWNNKKSKIFTDHRVKIESEECVLEGIAYIKLIGIHHGVRVEYKWTDNHKILGLAGRIVKIQYMENNPGNMYNNYRKVISVEVVE